MTSTINKKIIDDLYKENDAELNRLYGNVNLYRGVK